ncbi:BMP family lipoprotein [Deinococcus hopiensis]|uniref:Nucleoside-binding protein n=1 Tax=Deinococcus hopiensis KR-140 TaxID=695939 RepID=A0A1W1VFR0_9DEIO|nr:BMP family ABC transporter substrate-binding protein [Deinococcus hopiensis]SMB92060.1 nucleoside-binding protein [Deinococcus hopiensis KR-140]
MRRVSLALLVAAPLLTLCTAQAASFTVGLAFDLGGRNDQGFNQAAYEGARRAVDETGGSVQTYEPKTLAEVGKGISGLADRGASVVIGIGFANNDAVSAAASGHKDTRFVTVDDLPKGDNTVGLRFREQEGSFLAGYLAGKQSATGRLGFIGGVDIPVINRFRAGFVAGAKFACPSCKVTVAFVDTSSQGFNNAKKATQIAAGMMKSGVDVIYAAAGASGQGLVEQVRTQPCLKASALPAGIKFRSNAFSGVPRSAAEQKVCAGDSRPTFYIGVDVNQNGLGDFDKNPTTLNHGLTSVLKRVDNAVYSVVKEVAEGRPWRAGDRSFGLSNGGIALAVDQYNRALIPDTMQANLDTVEKLIVSGTLKVPAK